MLVLTSSFFHLAWFLFVVFISLLFLVLLTYLLFYSYSSLVVVIKLFSWVDLDFPLVVFLDYRSLLFSFLVLFVTAIVIIFSSYYISSYPYTNIFIALTIMFVFSMLILVNFADFFMLMLGWDGLGVVSFFLILFYHNSSSIYSGLITLLVNRLGDSLLILFIVLFFYTSLFSSHVAFWGVSWYVVCPFIVGCMTNSALFPFSPWLPAAMAAPTPISALVHSSTLVTAGLYLMMRFYYIVSYSGSFNVVLVIMGLFTSLYAGLASLVEIDLKKLVALSTLSHLGFICVALFSGCVGLSYFHLLVHALFKSLLFMSVGEIISLNHHHQDKRHISSNSLVSGHSSLFIMFSLFGLLGMPFVSGFYSNDFILEAMAYSFSSSLVVFILYLNVFLTYSYSLTIFMSSVSFSGFYPFNVVSLRSLFGSFCMVFLGLSSVVFASVFLWGSSFTFVVAVPSSLNQVPLLLLVSGLLVFLIKGYAIRFYYVLVVFYFQSMLFLTPIMSTFVSNLYVNSSVNFSKTFEDGALNHVLNSFSSFALLSFSSFINLLFSFVKVSLIVLILLLVLICFWLIYIL